MQQNEKDNIVYYNVLVQCHTYYRRKHTSNFKNSGILQHKCSKLTLLAFGFMQEKIVVGRENGLVTN